MYGIELFIPRCGLPSKKYLEARYSLAAPRSNLAASLPRRSANRSEESGEGNPHELSTEIGSPLVLHTWNPQGDSLTALLDFYHGGHCIRQSCRSITQILHVRFVRWIGIHEVHVDMAAEGIQEYWQPM
jgi:hypothetical protein